MLDPERHYKHDSTWFVSFGSFRRGLYRRCWLTSAVADKAVSNCCLVSAFYDSSARKGKARSVRKKNNYY